MIVINQMTANSISNEPDWIPAFPRQPAGQARMTIVVRLTMDLWLYFGL